MLSAVTQHVPSITVLSLLREITGIEWINGHRYFTDTAMIVNGVIIGFTKIPEKIYIQLKAAKYSFRLHPYTGISWNVHSRCINIDTDGGRVVRPVFRIVNGKIPEMEPSDDWNDWIKTCIEYIDPTESEFAMIAMFPSEMM